MEIKANDLRIGNLINDDNVVIKITRDNVVCLFRGQYYNTFESDEISGIPLTEELLLKMGFEKNVETDTWFLHIKQPISKHNFSLIQVSLLVTNGTYFDVYIDNNFTMICEFVHDLQNIVYMLGKKELTLS